MRAVVIDEDGGLAVEQVEVSPGRGEILLRVSYCGICGTDLHTLRYPEVFNSGPGTVMGHEFSGAVAAMGEGVSGWNVGDRAVAIPVLACGVCGECTQGFDWRCRHGAGIGLSTAGAPGAYAEYVRVSPHSLFRIPDELSDQHAALTEPLAVGLHSVNRVRLAAGEPCLIMGAGPVGLFTLIWAHLRGAAPIVVSDPVAERRAQAETLGAHASVNPNDQDPASVMRELTGGARPSVVFDCVGTPATLQEATRLAARNGRVAVVGVCLQPSELQPMTAHGKELDIAFVFAYTHDEFGEALKTLAAGAVPADRLISDVVPLARVADMFEQLARPTTQVKVLIDPWAH
jgi:(R,R)-butanediol dehydrogenase/meso-butanediol dehydrogenase/diacetyl reductase